MAMAYEEMEQLRRQYTDQYVMVQGDRPELARFQGVVGQVRTVNQSGRALVQFEAHNDRGWHDIEVAYLQIVAKPEPPPPVEKKPCAGKPTTAKPADPSPE